MSRLAKIKVIVSSITEVADDMDNTEIAQKLGAAYGNLLDTVSIPHDFIEVEIEPLKDEKPKLEVVKDKYIGPV